MGWCLKHTSPIVAMAYMPIQPITASILSFIFFNETLSLFFVIGGAVILVGLVFVIYGRYHEIKSIEKSNNNDNNTDNNTDNNNNNNEKDGYKNNYQFYLEDDD